MNKRPNASFPPPNHSTLPPKATHDKVNNKVTGGNVWTPSTRTSPRINSDTVQSIILIVPCLVMVIASIMFILNGLTFEKAISGFLSIPVSGQVVDKQELNSGYMLLLSDAETKIGVKPSNIEAYNVSKAVYDEFKEGSSFNKDEIQKTLYKKD
jgi:hypothetical protein